MMLDIDPGAGGGGLAEARNGGGSVYGLRGIGNDLEYTYGPGIGYIPRQAAQERIAARRAEQGGEPLTEEQKHILWSMCYGSQCDNVRVHYDRDEGGRAYGRDVHLARDWSADNAEDIGTLAHEVYHSVVQFEQWGDYYFWRGAREQWVQRGILGQNIYDWQTPYSRGRSFASIGMEAQAQAVGDCIGGHNSNACGYSGYQF